MRLRQLFHLLLGRRTARSEPFSSLLVAPADDPLETHGASWLVLLRWVAVIGQLVTIGTVRYLLGVDLPLGPMLAVVAVTAVSNVALAVWSSLRPDGHAEPPEPGAIADRTTMPVLELILLLDIVLLTVLLSFSGGPVNPFFIFYFVNLCLSAVVLPRGWALANTLAAVASFVLLFFAHRPLPAAWTAARMPPVRPGGSLSQAEWGLLVAFATCSAVIVYFTSLLRDQLRKREHQVRAFQAGRARTQKLEALGTLAAGAAHELANPLATIAVVAREVERRVAGTPAEPTVAKDIALIRSELGTCRNILQRMSTNAGQAMGERLVTVTAAELVDETLDGLQQSDRVAVSVDPAAEDVSLSVPLVGLAQAIRGIVQNALAATSGGERVTVAADRLDGRLRLVVRDEGVGMTPMVLARVGDPFFTTKQPGHGTGLGVFLARAVVERLDGSLKIDSAPGRGTTVTILLPVANG
jgi:two-component system sensor histidine kinase RegB